MVQASTNSWAHVTLPMKPSRSGRDKCEKCSSGSERFSFPAEMFLLAGASWDLEGRVYLEPVLAL